MAPEYTDRIIQEEIIGALCWYSNLFQVILKWVLLTYYHLFHHLFKAIKYFLFDISCLPCFLHNLFTNITGCVLLHCWWRKFKKCRSKCVPRVNEWPQCHIIGMKWPNGHTISKLTLGEVGVTAIQGSEEHSKHIVWAISFALPAHGSFPAEQALVTVFVLVPETRGRTRSMLLFARLMEDLTCCTVTPLVQPWLPASLAGSIINLVSQLSCVEIYNLVPT